MCQVVSFLSKLVGIPMWCVRVLRVYVLMLQYHSCGVSQPRVFAAYIDSYLKGNGKNWSHPWLHVGTVAKL